MNLNRVVVTGYGLTSAIGNTPEAFWDSLKNGKIGIGPLTKFDTSDYNVHIAAEIKEFPFDKYFVKKDNNRYDPYSLYALYAAREAVANANLDTENLDHDRFGDLIELIGETQPNMPLIFQEFIEASHGRDLRVFVIDGKVVAAMQRTAGDGGFKANFSRGGKVENFKIDSVIAELAIESAQTLGLDIAGIDILFDKKGYKICEANAAPDFRGLESCCNVSIADEIMSSIANRLAVKDGDDVLRIFDTIPGMLSA